MDIKWLLTNAYVASALRIAHLTEIYSSFTNPEPSHLSATPVIETAYCLTNCNQLLIRYVTTWEYGKREETEEHKYFLGIGSPDDDDDSTD